jgi:multidrug efflux pump
MAVFSRFFIHRPIFAAVLSIVITLAGLMSLWTLPLAQFPRVVPPTIQVQATYPGASAEDVAASIAAPIEQEVNGVEGMMYMSSACTNDGAYNLTVTFKQGVDLDMAQVLVQNRVNLALPKLPDVIKATGVTTRKRSADILMGLALYSPNGRYDQLYLGNYALCRLKDELLRVPGVGDVFLFGQHDYAMRVWVNPDKLAARGLTAMDVANAIAEQNSQVAVGMIGQQPVRGGQEQQLPIDTLGRLTATHQFENIVVRATPDGRLVRIKDIARVELGGKDADTSSRIDGKPNIFLAVFQLPDANALDTAERVLAKMDELKESFPEDVEYTIGFDTIPYTRESIKEVFNTLRDAILLVAFVVLLFLQNWRTAIIPLVAVPVAIIGSFAVMLALGFSLNNLTLFGLVLAIGIVVDDAIVVVEAVEHHIENGLAPRAATIKAMEQVSGPVIAIGLVLSAVFVPCAFVSGITGQFFRQFAVTISASTIISAFNSLTLSPALTALLLRPVDKGASPPLPRLAFPLAGGLLAYFFLLPWLGGMADSWAAEVAWLADARGWLVPALAIGSGVLAAWVVGGPVNRLLRSLFQGFNRGVARVTDMYVGVVHILLRACVPVLLVYGVLVAGTYALYTQTPRGFVPNQDMGSLYVSAQLPDAASMERTEAVMRQLSTLAECTEGVKHVTAVAGMAFAINANGSNFGSMFVNLNDYPDRRDPYMHADRIKERLEAQFATVLDAKVAVFGPPPIKGVGRTGGFTIMIEDRGDLGPHALQKQAEELSRLANGKELSLRETERLLRAGVGKDLSLATIEEHISQAEAEGRDPDKLHQELDTGLTGLYSVFRANVPQLKIEPDRAAVMSRGVSLKDFSETVSFYQGSLYVNDFNLFGRTWRTMVQSDAPYRNKIEQLRRLAVRNKDGGMVPLGSMASVRTINGPLLIARYNLYPAAPVTGAALPGVSSGQSIDIMQKLADSELPKAMAYEWTDMSYLELLSGSTGMIIFGFAVVMVFLVLAAQYESWSLPLAVILVVPMCLLNAIAGVNIAKLDINIFTQIGFVVLVGLASKNAILIVEFAKKEREAGAPRREAALAACRLRLRPILMTSLAFILGVVPLMVSHGAGAEMRQTLGTAVFYGMLGVTLFGIFLTPVFFYVINRLSETHLLAALSLHGARAAAGSLLSRGGRRLWQLVTPRPRRRARVPSGNGSNGEPAAPVTVVHVAAPDGADGARPTNGDQAIPDVRIIRK